MGGSPPGGCVRDAGCPSCETFETEIVGQMTKTVANEFRSILWKARAVGGAGEVVAVPTGRRRLLLGGSPLVRGAAAGGSVAGKGPREGC